MHAISSPRLVGVAVKPALAAFVLGAQYEIAYSNINFCHSELLFQFSCIATAAFFIGAVCQMWYQRKTLNKSTVASIILLPLFIFYCMTFISHNYGGLSSGMF